MVIMLRVAMSATSALMSGADE